MPIKTTKQTPENKPKPTDAEKVAEYMSQLNHPLKAEIEAVRTIIKNANTRLCERIKGNAPSYYADGVEVVTFAAHTAKKVHLVFTMKQSQKLFYVFEGDYKDRRMMYFKDINEIETRKKELERIINEYVCFVKNQRGKL